MDPTEAELAQINDVQGASDWAGLGDLRQPLMTAMGGVQRVREVALIQRPIWDQTIQTLMVDEGDPPVPRAPTPVELARIESFRSLRVGSAVDYPGGQGPAAPAAGNAPFPPVGGAPGPAAAAGQAATAPAASTTRRLKLSAILDPTLDAEITPLTAPAGYHVQRLPDKVW